MTAYAFTGSTRPLDSREFEQLQDVIAGLDDAESFITGAAFGVDTAAHIISTNRHRGATHRVAVPAAMHNEDLVRQAAEAGCSILYAAKGRTAAESYMLRNDLLVAECDVLIAVPETAEEVMRSGTWATVRRARDAGREVRLRPRDGVTLADLFTDDEGADS